MPNNDQISIRSEHIGGVYIFRIRLNEEQGKKVEENGIIRKSKKKKKKKRGIKLKIQLE